MSKKQKFFAVVSLVSGFLIHMTFGATYTLGTITPYMASYLFYHGQPDIKIVDVSLINPLNMIFQSFGIAISMIYLQKNITYRPLAFFGITGFVGSYFVTTFTSKLIFYLIFYASLAGLFQGVAYMIPFLNCYEHLPRRKGFSSGICMTAYGAGSFLFNFIILKLVNPNNQAPNQNHIFSQKVADNFPIALRYMCILYILIGALGCSLIIRKRNFETKEKTNSIYNEDINKNITSIQISTSLITQQDETQTNKLNTNFEKACNSQDLTKKITPIKELLKTKQYYQLVFLIITSVPFGAFIAYNYKEYGQTVSKNDQLITLTGSIGGVSNSLSRIFWCFLFDYFSFKKIITTMSIVNLGLIIGFYFNQNENLYIFLIIAAYFFYGANFGIYPTQTVRIYGQTDGSRIYPFVFGGFTLSATLQFLLHFFVISEYGDSGFKYCFFAFGILQCISIMLLIKFKFKYKQTQEKLLLKKQKSSNLIQEQK